MRAPSLKAGMTTENGESMADPAAVSGLFVDIDHEFASLIDMASVHPAGVERQSDRACFVDGDQAPFPSKLRHLVQDCLSRLRQTQASILHESGDVVAD